MRRLPLPILLALATAVGVSAAPAFAAGRLPGDLQRLIAAGERLHPTHFVERISMYRRYGGRRVRVAREALAGRLEATGETLGVSYARDGHTVHSLYVGAYAYATASGLARVDGGHAWIREYVPQLQYARLAALELTTAPAAAVLAADAVRELGRCTVAGEPVTAFELASPGGVRSHLYLAADGLLVRRVVLAPGAVTTYESSLRDPVALPVPPAAETVGLARLGAALQARLQYLFTPPFA